ncbi:NAD(P)-binding protein [Aspergillus aculeatinus CBS 121060]|uniref:NAD(P)-binding protein n=1 Tax=Aspergillus aculeatinus CBS 121060 TaxID=1448322 RepID=A0ACD1GRD6_9EURO|nr:NAD(P)-binding protein [Aspergillus aculeatinus CBS 121060]RAH63878.1 NAD(P)-binding protein [Aspergillus aculeatinus CBS 121060]
MPLTVGIAGITGKFSRLVLKNLLRNHPNVQIRGFCRNASKLPGHLRSSDRITIIQGDSMSLDDAREFVRGSDVIVCGYLGDNEFMTAGQKVLVDACELESVPRYIASDYCLDFTQLELGQHPAKDPMKLVKSYLDSKPTVQGVHVLIGAFMETFWSRYFGIFDPAQLTLSYWGDGDEVWESTTYSTAAEFVAAVATDPKAVGMQHFLGDRKTIRQIADEFAQVYGRKPRLVRLGSKDQLYQKMHAIYDQDPSNIYAYLALFYQYYCTNGQTYLKPELDNSRYPSVKPMTFRQFLQSHSIDSLSDSYQNAGSDA